MEQRYLLPPTFHIRPHVGADCRAGRAAWCETRDRRWLLGLTLPEPVGARNHHETAGERCDVLKRKPCAKHRSPEHPSSRSPVRVKRHADQRAFEVHRLDQYGGA